MTSRRDFIAKAIAGIGFPFLAPALASCSTQQGMIESLSGPNHNLGHRLRTMSFPKPGATFKTDVIIAGGGIAGLSAARFLSKANTDFVLLELEGNTGGNAMGGKNSSTAHPWGAHYLPLPNLNDRELISFLKESNVITGYKQGVPEFNEFYLCFDPKERLYINHYWQEGLIPHESVPAGDRAQIDRFLELMHRFKYERGADGKEAFAIPVTASSQDPAFLVLDTVSTSKFLDDRNFTSSYLKWYVNYCCLDDYGSTIEETSAWAMIHYFASRKGTAANTTSDTVLTWPEGNSWLANKLRQISNASIRTHSVIFDIRSTSNSVTVSYYDAVQDKSFFLEGKSLVLATPQFINKRLLPNITRPIDFGLFDYSTWLVANLRIHGTLDERRGEGLCWDNVLYGSSSLGYIHANHQHLQQPADFDKTLTYYSPQTSPDARQKAYTNTFPDWKASVLADLRNAHPDLEKSIKEMNCWVWGHGMVKPKPNFIWGTSNSQRRDAIDNKIFFAHSDLSGISIFEEAFINGYKAAKNAIGYA